MKIAINGEIIDTENIYKIDKIYEYGSEYSDMFDSLGFNIDLFNDKTIEVTVTLPIYFYGYGESISRKELGNKQDTGIIMEDATMEDFRKMPEYIEALTKISNLRDEIIKIWSNNQGTIPQFNI